MPNLGDMTPEEKRSYLQFLKDMATQQANEGLQGMVGDAQAMEQEYARNRPDPAAMESARGTDTAKSHMNMLMASLNSGNGNQGAAQVYGKAAAENPEQDALKNKQGAFMDYLKGLSGLKAQKNAVAMPFLQKREADARDAVSDFDKTQATAEASRTAAEQKAKHDELWAAVESGKMDERQAQNQFNRWLAGETLNIKKAQLALDASRVGDKTAADMEKADEIALQKMTKEIGTDPQNFADLISGVTSRIGGLTNQKKDLPGVGELAGRVPNLLTSDSGMALRNDLKAIVNALLKLQSGTGVSQSEREEAQGLAGLGPDMPEQEVYRGLDRAKKLAASAIKARFAGFKPEVVNMYKERGGLMPEKILSIGLDSAPAPDAMDEDAAALVRQERIRKLKGGK